MRYFRLLFIYIIVTSTLFATQKELLVKAVVLDRINQFITYKLQKTEFTVCIHKNKKMAESFKSLYKMKKYKKLPIKVLNIDSLKDTNMCDVLYLNNPSKKTVKEITAVVHPYKLLVTDDIKYLDDGLMVALYTKNNKIRFAINQQALVNANLKVNYRLLKVASKVINPIKAE